MIKVLIIDDEILIRTGIKTSIDWESMDMVVVGEASNGREGLEKALSLEPNIVVADVRMPVMDGLEFSRRLKEKMPHVRIIIISGFDDFKYAREALSLGVNEYLLKPIGADKLIKIIVKQRDEILRELDTLRKDARLKNIFKENLPFLQARFVNSLVKGEITDPTDIAEKSKELNVNLSGEEYQVAIIDIDDFFLITENLSDREKEQFKLSIKNIAEEILSPYTDSVVCFSEFDYLQSVINVGNANRQELQELYGEIQDCVKKHQRLTVTIGISNICKSVREIPQAYNEALFALRSKAFKGKGKIISINDVDRAHTLSPIIYPSADEKEIISCLKTMEAEKLDRVLEKIYLNFTNTKTSFEEVTNICLRLIAVSASHLEEIGVDYGKYSGKQFDPYGEIDKYETLEDIKGWLKNVFNSFIDAMQKSKKENYKGIVKVAMHYVNDHYNEDIGVEQMAAITYVTPNYFSRVFKKETGKSFTEWLNMVRLDKARVLLMDLKLRVYEVAEKVGYNDYKVFTHNFKKYFGCTPKEFRENSLKNQS